MKILEIGTAGFIGFHLAKKLLERGDEVVGIDNINDYYDINLKYGRLVELGIKQEEVESNNCPTEIPLGAKLKIHNSKFIINNGW